MSRRARVPRGIASALRSPSRGAFLFGRFENESLSSDENSDSEERIDPDVEMISESDDEARYSLATTSGSRGRSHSGLTIRAKTKSGKRKSGKKASRNETALEKKATESSGWSELIPFELLLRIFRSVVDSDGVVPFLCRMSRVCRRWKAVASDPMLWKRVNLAPMASMEALRFSASTDATIDKLARTKLAGVVELSLDGWSELTDSGLKAIGKRCHHLQSINLSQCENLSPKGISSLAYSCHKLKAIDVAMTKIDMACLHRVTKRLGRQLEELSLMNCGRLRGEMILPVIQENCPNLTILDLTGTNIRKLNVEKLQAGCPKLQELFLANLLVHSTPITADMPPTVGFPDLQYLCLACGSFGGLPMPDQLLQRILKTSQNLKALDIRRLQRVTTEGLKSLPANSLKTLLLSETQATLAIVSAAIEKWHNTLEVLELASNPRVADGAMDLLTTLEMPRLRSMDLAATNVTIEGVRKVLRGCPNLRELNLASCRGVPRDLKQRHEGSQLTALISRLTSMEQTNSEDNSE